MGKRDGVGKPLETRAFLAQVNGVKVLVIGGYERAYIVE